MLVPYQPVQTFYVPVLPYQNPIVYSLSEPETSFKQISNQGAQAWMQNMHGRKVEETAAEAPFPKNPPPSKHFYYPIPNRPIIHQSTSTQLKVAGFTNEVFFKRFDPLNQIPESTRKEISTFRSMRNPPALLFGKVIIDISYYLPEQTYANLGNMLSKSSQTVRNFILKLEEACKRSNVEFMLDIYIKPHNKRLHFITATKRSKDIQNELQELVRIHNWKC